MIDPSLNKGKGPKKTEKQTFNRLVLLYSIAVVTLALVVLLSERYLQLQLNSQLYDSKVVNLAGRQRMYSQKITKDLLLLNQDTALIGQEVVLKDIRQVLESWNKTHFGLINGDTVIGLPVVIDPNIKLELDTLTGIQQDFYNQVKQILEVDINLRKDLLSSILINVLVLEKAYLSKMDLIVKHFEIYAKRKVERAKNIQTLLAVITLCILFFEILFIFRPLAIYVRTQIKDLLNSEWMLSRTVEKSKKLQEYLQASNDDLQNVYFALEEAALFARATSNGDVYYISEQFLEKLYFDRDKTFKYNIFKLLDAEEWKRQIENSMVEKSVWRSELKLRTFNGSFLWIDARIVPVLSDEKEIKDLLIICNDITHRKWAEQKVYQLNRERYLQKAAEQRKNSIIIVEALEKERKRISRDIHDGLGQLLIAIKFNLQSINLSEPSKAKGKLFEIKEHVAEIIKETRRLSFNLAPSSLEDYGLSSALKTLAVKTQAQTGIHVDFIDHGTTKGRLPKNIEVNIYRICQEALNNAVKHSKASHIAINISMEKDVLRVKIRDNGVGFDAHLLKGGNKQFAAASGILNMKERVNFFEGDFKIESIPGKGTLVSIILPSINNIHVV